MPKTDNPSAATTEQAGTADAAELSPRWRDMELARLSERQREDFRRNGFLVVENVLSAEEIALYRQVLKTLDETITQNYGGRQTDQVREPGSHLELRNAVAHAPEIRDLMVHPKAFSLLLDIMGPNICLTTSHALLRPPSPGVTRDFKQAGWHRDGQAYSTYDNGPTLPWLYCKIGFFLTDTTIPDCGALRAVPGSHRFSGPAAQDADHYDPYGAVDIGVKPGSIIIFDNRIYHSVGPNYSDVTRENIYIGYCWRHIRPIDYIQQSDDVFDGATPIQSQLLGKVGDSCGFYLPQPGDTPLVDFYNEINTH